MPRTATFSNIGIDISALTTSHDVLTAARLDYNVVKKPMFYGIEKEIKSDAGLFVPGGGQLDAEEHKIEYVEYPDKVFTVNETTGQIYGVVSKQYEVCQNADAFSFIDYIGQECDGFQYVKAGETESGLIYIIAKIPNVTILGDKITPYIIFQNSHDGLNSVKATISPLRIVCQNQFNTSFRHSPNTVRIIHSSQMEERIISARSMLQDVASYMSTFNETAEQLATKKVSYSEVINIFNDVFKYDPENWTPRKLQNFENKRGEFMACYTNGDNQNFVGTAWGVINGAADYLTHHRSNRIVSQDSVFVNTTLLSATLNRILDRVTG